MLSKAPTAWVPFMCLAAKSSKVCSAPDVEVLLVHRAFSTISLSLLVNELWSVLPSPKGAEDGVPDTATSFPSSSHSPRPRVMWKEQDSHSASTMVLAGSTLSDTSYREGINIEVEVAIESVPHPTREQSLCSPQSGQSLSGDSLEGTSDRCSVTGVPAERREQHSSELGDP